LQTKVSFSTNRHEKTTKKSLYFFQAIYIVTYESKTLASYAVEKLNKFRYPSGEIIHVAYYESFLNYISSNKTLLDNMNIFGAKSLYADNMFTVNDDAIYELNQSLSRASLIA
jgi:hypothetical protein